MMAIADYIFDVHGAIRIDDAARQAELGARQFERNFLREIGITPKHFCAGRPVSDGVRYEDYVSSSIMLEIAHHLRYFDQMHMIHEFRSLLGESPSGILPQLGDARPPALCAPDSQVERVLHYSS
jgi:AraC-like DNA-binding protein